LGSPRPFIKQTSASVHIKTRTSSKDDRYFSKFNERYKANEAEYRRLYEYEHTAARISAEKLPAPGLRFWLRYGVLSFTVNLAPLKDCCLNETGRFFEVQGACYLPSPPTATSSACINLTLLLTGCGLLPSSSCCSVLKIGRCMY
jgi:hypothetical protein